MALIRLASLFALALVFVDPVATRPGPPANLEPESSSPLPLAVPGTSATTLSGVFSRFDHTDPLAHHQSRVVLIVLDGIRTEEFFKGAWTGRGRNARRRSPETVMPFIHETLIQKHGAMVLGNRFAEPASRCLVNNNRYISLPGYADLLGGTRQPNVASNRFRGVVRYPTVVDRLVGHGMQPGEVAVFASWRHIRNVVSRAVHPDMHLDTGYQAGLQRPPWGDARYDADLMRSIDEYLDGDASRNLRFLFVSFNDTDEWAHKSNYRNYISALEKQDEYIRKIYTTLEERPAFRGRTTYIITTDHGRGIGRYWAHHGRFAGSQYIWAVVHSPRPRFVSAREHSAWQRGLAAACSHTSLGRFMFRLLDTSSARTVEVGRKSGY